VKPSHPAFPKSSPASVADVPASLEDQLRAASASPSVANQPLTPQQPATPKNVALARSPSSCAKSPPQIAAPEDEEEGDQTTVDIQLQIDAQLSEVPVARDEEETDAKLQVEDIRDGPFVDPKQAIPPTVDDVAIVSDALIPPTNLKETPKAAQVVHLPPQDVQEAKLKETERNLEVVAEKERKEDERLAPPNSVVPTDFVSSPSSTIGPYSQATPHHLHHSPDTSPDTESFLDHEPPTVQNAIGSDSAAQRVKEEHDHLLQQQMQSARERARAEGSETPEVERQIEDEQAIRLVRDGKSRLSEAQTAAGFQVLTEHAQELARGIESDSKDSGISKASAEEQALQAAAADSLPTPTTIAPEPSMNSDRVDNVRAKPQESAPMGVEHPTPPADDDVEMDDAPLPVKEQPEAPPQPQSSPHRMTTRVSSGAIRQRTVAELIADKEVLTPTSSNLSASVSPARPRASDMKKQEIATVIFAKQDLNRASKALQSYNEDYASLQGASQDSSRDYLEGLFQYQAHHPPRSVPLQELVASARKTLSTAGTLAMIREQQDYKILKRVYQLQNANRWSLRQLQKSAEPPRPITHHDHLLTEMKWMQTDFKEERKWKKALATSFAEWCAEYVNSSPEEQVMLRVRARVPTHARHTNNTDEDLNDAPTPELMASGANETENESFADDEELYSLLRSNPPAGLFTLGFNEVVMKIDHNHASDAMLRELPCYEPMLEGANDVTPVSFCDPPILPVSKFVTGKLISKVRGPSKKRSRYEYESEDEPSTPPSRSGTSAEHSMPSTPGRRLFHRNDLPPEMSDVALFNPENKHVRDRLQVAHQFRPPTEFPMPSVSFFENRNSSQWLWEEDQKLRGLVKEYTFNWSLVAQQLALPSEFVSGSGRRTPWECFERWVQLEGLPSEMSKTQYFRTYQTRLEQAQRTIVAQHQAQQQLIAQQAQQGQNVSTQPRRRTTQPIRVERRRENRHLAIIDGMRKLARKRESIAHKQAESQKAAALRKAQEPVAPKSNVHTPQEFSRIRWEREEKIQQKMKMQHEISMRASSSYSSNVSSVLTHEQQAMAQRQAQMQGQSGMPNGVNQQQRNGAPGSNSNVVPAPMANQSSQQGLPVSNVAMVARSHPNPQAMQGNFANGNMPGMTMGNSGVPQAQMHAAMPGVQRMPPPNQAQMQMQRQQFPNSNQQQQQYQLQQHQINMASNLTQNIGMNGIPNANMIANANMLAGQNMNGNMAASMNGMPNNAGSPRPNQVNPNMQGAARPLSSGHMPQLLQIQNSLKNQHPEWSAEQVQRMASEQLSKFLAKQRAQAMTAAAGSSGLNTSPQIGNNVYLQNSGMANSPSPNAVQNYQQQLVAQQRMMSQAQQRQSAASPGLNASVSRSATPQNPGQLQQSPGLQQAQLSRN
jgi:chromatin modification-related protein VID21